MHRVKNFLSFVVFFFFLALLQGCGGGGGGGDDAPSVRLVSLELSSIDSALEVGDERQLRAAGLYSNSTAEDLSTRVTWSVDDESVATVSGSGLLTALAVGTTTVRASLDGLSAQRSATVSPASLQAISISAPVSRVAVGISTRFSAVGLYSDGQRRDISDQVAWSVSDLNVATIDPDSGLLTGAAEGEVTVTASEDGGLNGTAEFTVSPATLQGLQVNPASLSLARGTSRLVAVTGIFSDGSNQNVTEQVGWSSSAENLAVVTGSSLVEALEQGTATLTASLEGEQVDLAVTVTDADLVSLSLTPVNASIPLGLSLRYVAQGTFTDGSVQDLSDLVTWTSSDQTVAVISNSSSSRGRVDTLALGTSTITAVADGVAQSTDLTVDDAQLTSIDLEPTQQTVANGSDATIRAFGQYTDGSRIDIGSSVNWNTGSPGLIDLTLVADGRIRTLAQGEALVTAELDGISSLANISVTDAILTSISIESAATSLADGTSLKLIARGQFSDDSSQDISDQVTWETSDSSVLTVVNGGAEAGTITGQRPETATIFARFGGEIGQEIFTVSPAVIENDGLLIMSPKTDLNVNEGVQASAQATYSDGSVQDVTNQVNWTSSQVSIASVDNTQGNKGRIRALSVGETQIRASISGVQSNNLPVTVTQNPDLPIALTVRPQPNIIVNDGNDPSDIRINVIPALPSGTVADGTTVMLTINEGETERMESLSTNDGVASYTLRSNHTGVVTLTATLGDLTSRAGVLATPNLENAIIAQGLSQAVYENDTLKADSIFVLLVRNLSNRVFNVDRISIQYLDPNNDNQAVQFPGSPFTSPEATSNGDLTAGEFTSIGYQLDNDIEASVYEIIYEFSDDTVGTLQPLRGRFDFAAP
ncbi:Ig-like domain-containing protein [Marinobacter confluentis]|uniref:BIG2 domain-containing protein n=1 Tax=Marinobacter confluentis TaxID=1697557 RepID=A0A4Z1CBU8_9GAMM|nr:Ig-like domain-containing protein [Marinobacter confluentis]TGN41463.1 hypothetical protein E5Q11_02675 [Marinobacter confluentis]